MFFSFIPGLRAARRIGVAERREHLGELEGALKASSEALEILRSDSVDLKTPWCRSAASVALWSYARVSRKLGLEQELRDTLTRWRPLYLGWIKRPVTPEEGKYLQWFEDILNQMQRT